MSTPQPLSHSEMINALAHGSWDRRTVEPPIVRSWKRSADHYQLDPSRSHPPQVISEFRLRDYRAPLEPLLQIARRGMESLFSQVRDAGYVVLLTDANGVTVDFMNNEPLDRELRQAGLYLGACWSEELEGTCAVGLCAVEKVPVTVHHAEHFRKPNTTLTCSAAPIRSETGELLAVLDASALYSPHEKRSQLLIMQMVAATVRQIENAYFLRRFEHQWVLRVNRHSEFMEVASEGLVALDEDGRILAANAPIHQQIAETQAPLVGRRVDDVFGLPFGRIADAAAAPVVLHWPRAGAPCFGQARAPHRPVLSATVQAAPLPVRERGGDVRALPALAGGDPQMQASVERALRVLDKGIPVLLHGETGTGKEVFAKAIHHASSRAGAAFVALNCAAIPESLIESELFGYREGAFTGARAKGVRGKIAQADGGTLFLDEIGDMPLALQTRLLRVLAEREVMPLGAEKAQPVDLQLICATHRDLDELVRDGSFRQDLFYRLNAMTLKLPALRDRADKAQLIKSLLIEEARGLRRDQAAIADETLAVLLRYDLPGNIRQLRNTLRSALALSDTGTLELAHLPSEICGVLRDLLPPPQLTDLGFDRRTSPAGDSLSQETELLAALRHCHWNVSEAARLLGLSRATIYRKMVREGIVQPNYRG